MNRLFIVLAVFAIASCSHPEIQEEEQVPVTLTYTTVQAVGVKAAQNLNDGTFASGETVKVQISNAGASSWTGYDFTTGEGGAMVAPEPGPYYPAGSVNIDIAAYYPATAGASFSVASDQTSDADYKASDLMFASKANQAKQAAPVNLQFSHKLAKINVNITAGDGVGSIESVTLLNVKPTVSFNQTTGEVGEAGGALTSISVSNNGAAIFPGQTISGGLLSIVTDKGTATYTVENKEFEAGKQYTMNITVNLRAVGASTAITGWGSEGTVNVYPVSDALTVLNATAEHVGWIIASDGYIYPNKAAVDASGKTGVALIFHIGDPGSAEANSRYRGLAVALDYTMGGRWGYSHANSYCLTNHYSTWSVGASTDAVNDMSGIANTGTLFAHDHSGENDYYHYSAKQAVNFTPAAPVGTSGWFLGSAGQWNLFLHGYCGINWDSSGSSTNGNMDTINAKYKESGYTNNIIEVYDYRCVYYTSTECTDGTGYGSTHLFWALDFYSDESVIDSSPFSKTGGGGLVLPFLAF